MFDLGRFSVLGPIHNQQVSLDGGSARRKTVIYKQDNTNTESTQAGIHVLRGIRTFDPSVCVGEYSWSFMPRGHCNRRILRYPLLSKLFSFMQKLQ
jgi:hypothetical protein